MVSRATGARAAMLLGCLIFSSGAALTHWTLDWGLGWVAATYGFVSALGQVRRSPDISDPCSALYNNI